MIKQLLNSVIAKYCDLSVAHRSIICLIIIIYHLPNNKNNNYYYLIIIIYCYYNIKSIKVTVLCVWINHNLTAFP